MIDLGSILKAHHLIRSHVHNSPLMLSETLSRKTGAQVYIKLESLQKTGAFKVRGIYNKILSLQDSERQNGFITASSGNHGLGLAYVCKELGLKATIVVPEYTPKVKIDAISREGAELVLHGQNWNASFEHATLLSQNSQQHLIHPFDDDYIISGQGTIALEILEQLENPDYFLASIGGGSMMAANSLVFKSLSPKTRVIGLQTFGADAMFQSVKSGELVELTKISSRVESFATKKVSSKTLELVKQFVDEIILLQDQECTEATLFMLERSNILLELSASICVAALLRRKFEFKPHDKIVLVLCGGNFDLLELAAEISKQRS